MPHPGFKAVRPDSPLAAHSLGAGSIRVMTLPSSFTPGGATEAGALLSTYQDPKLDGRGASNAVIVSFDAFW